ncbi:hypothetical protein [Anaerocolumna sp.]|nr:hypothetical protein [Anaerocolumna sp.]
MNKQRKRIVNIRFDYIVWRKRLSWGSLVSAVSMRRNGGKNENI